MAKQNMIIPCNLLMKIGIFVDIDLFIIYLYTIKYKCLCLHVIVLLNSYILL